MAEKGLEDVPEGTLLFPDLFGSKIAMRPLLDGCWTLRRKCAGGCGPRPASAHTTSHTDLDYSR